ncbi:MAG TPA: hypothetical protein DEH78_30360 [Solibacterales bacterium]|nr:hypothetical protein [Bryobacterales bacterium]
MKLHADPLTHLNTVTAYGPGFVEINKVRHDGNLVVAPDRPLARWSATGFDALSEDDFAALLPLAPEVVLLGTGSRQRFPHPSLTHPLTAARVGVEVMDTPAACRTYNILMAEGRRVVAAFIVEEA